MTRLSCGGSALAVTLTVALLAVGGRQLVLGDQPAPSSQLSWLKQSMSAFVATAPDIFDASDLDNFFNDRGATSAQRFLNQRGQNGHRALKLAQRTLKWRKEVGLNQLEARQFPCDLFMLGLIFESGRAHRHSSDSGQYVETNPVIWVRLGALGSIIKQLERVSLGRTISYAYNTPRATMHRLHKSLRTRRHRQTRVVTDRFYSEQAYHQKRHTVRDMSMRANKSLRQVLMSIVWWLEDWMRRQGEAARATLVLDFEGTDFAFASWSVGEFFVTLDDKFPDLFEQIIGFRYKPNLWSLHTPISMFNRIFKSRVSSSPETDRKLRFVSSEPQIGAYMPRIDSSGFTLLPEHVSGFCMGPNEAQAPKDCLANSLSSNTGNRPASDGLIDANFWRAVHNEFYQTCRPRVRPQ